MKVQEMGTEFPRDNSKTWSREGQPEVHLVNMRK